MKKWAIVTSNEVRHRFLANKLAEAGSVSAIISERKSTGVVPKYLKAQSPKIEDYFRLRNESERKILSSGIAWSFPDGVRFREVPDQMINDSDIVRDLILDGIDHCLVFGSSILKEPWLSAFSKGIFNLHLGLSPYYRGSGTNFWALYDGKPELVGATLHVLTSGIDAGDILLHVRPQPEVGDSPHSFGNKTIVKAAKAISKLMVLDLLPPPVPQWEVDGAQLCKRSNFDEDSLVHLEKGIENGLFEKYVLNLRERADAVRLVNEYEPV